MMIVINKDDNNIEYGSKQYNSVYNNHMQYYYALKERSLYDNSKDDIVNDMIQDNIYFSVKVVNDNPYKCEGMVLVSITLCYVGTNTFSGYISKELCNSLLDTYSEVV